LDNVFVERLWRNVIVDKFSQKNVSEGSSEATGPQQEAA